MFDMNRHAILTGLVFLILMATPHRPASGIEEPAPPKPWTLEQSITYALEHSPVLAEARHDWGVTKARQGHSRSAQLPRLAANLSHFSQGPVVEFFGEKVGLEFRNTAIFSVTQPIIAPELSARHRQASHIAQASGANYEATRHQVILEATKAYLEELKAGQLLIVAEASKQLAQEWLRVAEAQFKAGNQPKYDVLRAEVGIASAEEQLTVARNNVAIAKAIFNNVLGRPIDTPVVLQPLEVNMDAANQLKEKAAYLFSNRPEIYGLTQSIRAAREGEQAARASTYPSILFSADYTFQRSTVFMKPLSWNVGMGMMIPLFDSGATRSGVREAKEKRRALNAIRLQLEQSIELEVRKAQVNIKAACQRNLTNARAVRHANEAVRIAKLRYEANLAPLLEVLDAETALTNARTNLINARYDYAMSQANYKFATGTLER